MPVFTAEPLVRWAAIIALLLTAGLAWAQTPPVNSAELPQGNVKPGVAKIAQTNLPAAGATATTPKLAPNTKPQATLVAQANEASPLWKELSPAEQAALKPLAANWSTVGEAQKRKWLVVSKNYATLPPAEQQKLHGRMTQWVSLSPKQRTDARLNFAETKTLTPTEKVQGWKDYQALSPQEKQKLAEQAAPKTSGAATAVKPVPTQKLAAVPTTRNSPKGIQPADTKSSVDKNTLLPLAAGSAEPGVQKN